MATIMECIERIPSVMEGILERQGESFRGLAEYVGGAVEGLDEVVFIGSGTSNTAAMTSQAFVEKVSGLRTKVVLPNDYIREGVCTIPMPSMSLPPRQAPPRWSAA